MGYHIGIYETVILQKFLVEISMGFEPLTSISREIHTSNFVP